MSSYSPVISEGTGSSEGVHRAGLKALYNCVFISNPRRMRTKALTVPGTPCVG